MNEQATGRIQQALPAYEIGDELGRGAFGVVYEARHTQLGRSVAIKQLPQSFAEDEDVRERFVAEAQMVASLEHPHIVPVYDFVESSGSRFLIMERCAGSVGDRFKEEGIVTDEACAAVLACLAALDFAHEKGLLHRDVKPENLMYDTKGVIKLGDFGIARDLGVETRRTATGMIVGTPAYMSPEQCRGDDLTPASDVYSVAMMGYELLTGALPFPHTDSVNGLLAHHLVTVPTPLLSTRPELPGSVGEVIDRALAKDLNERYSTAEEFATALARACVTAFGSGWLRRRRFVLHWPEIIAETERADSNSPRTGTIMVRAGDLPHAVVVPEDQVEPTAQFDPQPVAVVGNADAPTIPPESATPAAAPQAAPVAPSAKPIPPSTPTPLPEPAPSTESSGGPNLALIGAAIAAIVAVVVGVLVFAGGGSGDQNVAVPANDTPATAVADDDASGDQPADDDPADQPEPTTGADDDPADGTDPTDETDQTAGTDETAGNDTAEPTTAPAEDDPAQEATPIPTVESEQPFILGSNGFPIQNRIPENYAEYSQPIDSPWTPNPCPIEREKVACIFGPVDATADDGTLSVNFFTSGFTAQIEPIGEHIHFYIPELVEGDETKAGTETPGGAWRIWDGPWPATSFGGDNGRTLYTLADFRAADSTTLCIIMADEQHRAIPGTGNCAPVVSSAEEDFADYQVMVERLEGQWVGSCATGAMAIAPPDWRWYDLAEYDTAELAGILRPQDVERTTELLDTLVSQGGVIWAEGPVEGDFIVNFSMTLIPGDFTLNDDPQRVAEVLRQLGISTENGGQRLVGNTDRYFATVSNRNSTAARYVIPDFGYAIEFTLTAPDGQGYGTLADQIAYTISGC